MTDEDKAQEILHGASGDASLKHTQHEAPLPKPEKGDGIGTTGLARVPAVGETSEHGGSGHSHSEHSGHKSASGGGANDSNKMHEVEHTHGKTLQHGEQEEKKKTGGLGSGSKGGSKPDGDEHAKTATDSDEVAGSKFDQQTRKQAEKFGANLDE